MKYLHMVSFLLVIVGALNWLAFGAFGKEIGSFVGGMDGVVARGIYILVGLAGVYLLATHKKECKWCAGGMAHDHAAVPMNK